MSDRRGPGVRLTYNRYKSRIVPPEPCRQKVAIPCNAPLSGYPIASHLSDEQKSYLRGKRYQAEKKEEGAQDENQNRKRLGQNVPVERTSEKLATEYNVDEKTIRRDAKFAEAVDAVAENL